MIKTVIFDMGGVIITLDGYEGVCGEDGPL